jgi:anti-sigma regulatory factor (Ser/Thr protein kinase)
VHASVCDIIADLAQNAIEADATRIEVDVATDPSTIRVRIQDNGKGMDERTLAKAKDPFYSEPGKHDRRRVGLGIPLLMQTASAVGGAVDIQSEPGKGTCVSFTLDARHLDTPPFGDLPETFLGLMAFGGSYDLILKRTTPADRYTVSRGELIDTLGNLEEIDNLILARAYVRSQEENLNPS